MTALGRVLSVVTGPTRLRVPLPKEPKDAGNYDNREHNAEANPYGAALDQRGAG